MKIYILLLTLFLLSVAAFAEGVFQGEGVAAIVNDDYGLARDEALNNAKVVVIERAVGVFVSETKIAENYNVVSQEILTKSEGFIETYKIIPNSEKVKDINGFKTLSIQIEAKVNMANVFTDLNSIESLYDSIGKPKFMVRIDSNINNSTDEFESIDSFVLGKLQDFGFTIVDPETYEKSVAKIYDLPDEEKELAKIAMSKGAQILVIGKANTVSQKRSDLSIAELKDLYFANTTLNIKMVYVDSGEILFTLPKSIKGEGKSFVSDREAARKSTEDAISKLFVDYKDRFNNLVIDRWAKEVSKGSKYYLSMKDINYNEYENLLKQFKNMRFYVGFEDENFNKNNGYVVVISKTDFQSFKTRLQSLKVYDKGISIISVNNNKISFTLE